MAIEIERKFLIDVEKFKSEYFLDRLDKDHIRQGYILNLKERKIALRVRSCIDGANETHGLGFITVKGPSDIVFGNSEFEMQVPFDYAESMLDTCNKVLSKTRYFVSYDGLIWEIDQFHGKLEGMWVAEVELEDEYQEVKLPYWVTHEVTKVPEFKNIKLIDYDTIPNVYYEIQSK